jgi:uncharacterized protein
MCKGQCPGTAIDGDWRNRTEHCEIWMQLFEYVEKRLLDRGILPLSLSPERVARELTLVEGWSHGRNPQAEHFSGYKAGHAMAGLA